MNRADYLTKPCPSWCVETHMPDPVLDDFKLHQTAEATFTPAEGYGIRTCIQSAETLEDDGPNVGPVTIELYSSGAELTSAEARQFAAVLLDQADKLDQITAG